MTPSDNGSVIRHHDKLLDNSRHSDTSMYMDLFNFGTPGLYEKETEVIQYHDLMF